MCGSRSQKYKQNAEALLTRTKGDVISKRYYDQLSTFIIRTLKNTDGITLVELIEKAKKEIHKDFGSISCLLLDVKKDLEVMGMITIEIFPDRTQFISLKKQRARKVNYMDIVRGI